MGGDSGAFDCCAVDSFGADGGGIACEKEVDIVGWKLSYTAFGGDIRLLMLKGLLAIAGTPDIEEVMVLSTGWTAKFVRACDGLIPVIKR
jgi:hypothetical protein